MESIVFTKDARKLFGAAFILEREFNDRAVLVEINSLDVDTDLDSDLVLRCEIVKTGIDAGDTSACPSGRD